VSDTIAAIDLGSNSFHMIVARLTEDGHLLMLDRLREMVQLAAGLDSRQRLSEEAQDRALECLARFGQRLRDVTYVRIVGTNTLRQARNSAEFLAKAEAVLGHPVEVVSGMEEARLIYLGVSHSIASLEGRRLVVDIGGGSTELIIGERFDPLYLESLGMGCVSMTQRYFPDSRIRETDLRAAELAVQLKMEPITLRYRELGWQHAIGASGSIKAIRDVVVAEGWSRDEITLSALHKLRATLLAAGKVNTIAERWNLHPARARVFTGGFVVLYGLCESLGIEQLQVADGALREGLIYDLVGRIRHEDVRHRTIAALGKRHDLDNGQAELVMATALELLTQARTDWGLEDEDFAYALEWAARLHEIGLLISHNQHHKHGAYVVQHADLPGFSNSEQTLLAALIRGQRREFPNKIFTELPRDLVLPARRLCVLLRLAVVLHRSRSRQSLPPLQLRVDGQQLELRFPTGWLEEHPLTRADLEVEAEYLNQADFRLEFGAAA
jgi:exopolyphosphatase/guanosine-5'-triphosphate,3'-diphosphate pyrophosphatase